MTDVVAFLMYPVGVVVVILAFKFGLLLFGAFKFGTLLEILTLEDASAEHIG